MGIKDSFFPASFPQPMHKLDCLVSNHLASLLELAITATAAHQWSLKTPPQISEYGFRVLENSHCISYRGDSIQGHPESQEIMTAEQLVSIALAVKISHVCLINP